MKRFIGEKIRKIREMKGYSQEYMAAKLDISQRTYSKLEREEIKLDWDRITDIAQILELDPVDLISFDDNFVFNHSPQSVGKAATVNNNLPIELKVQYEKLIEQYEARLREKDEIIVLLKKQIGLEDHS